jgi:quercetin dioxygenase-like cupin family protein
MQSISRSFLTITALVLGVAGSAGVAQAQAQSGMGMGMGMEKDAMSLKWGPAPDVFPAGAKMAVERGDPTKSGEFVVRLSFPAGYRIPPHWHPTDEHVRVRSGEFLVGMGDMVDQNKTMKLAAGDTGTIAAKMHHYAIARVATEISVRAEGPFALMYVNPADNPRMKH